MPIIAFPSAGNDENAVLDLRFGRAKNFVLYNENTKTFSVVENTQNMQANQGAGIQSAQNILDNNASVLISGNCGPKAFRVLNAAQGQIFFAEAKPIIELLQDYQQGLLKKAESANTEGHWV